MIRRAYRRVMRMGTCGEGGLRQRLWLDKDREGDDQSSTYLAFEVRGDSVRWQRDRTELARRQESREYRFNQSLTSSLEVMLGMARWSATSGIYLGLRGLDPSMRKFVILGVTYAYMAKVSGLSQCIWMKTV